MAAHPRCDSGHFLPATAQPGPCRCTRRRTRAHDHADLWGQGLTLRQKYTMTTVELAGSYL
ncbi:hypothetical protein ACWD4O_10320 [Streptomyces sp. NPDC002623]